MKILYLEGYGDYGACEFENEIAESPKEIYNLIINKDKRICDIENQCQCKFEILDFPNVVITDDFESFIRNKLQGYEASKHSNFYIIE